jgi:dolichyl-phosphate beta-glucosyltransferase
VRELVHLHASYSVDLVVPVFNEEDRLVESGPSLVGFVERFGAGSQLIIADDGSRDRTVEVANELVAGSRPDLVRVLELPHRGKGAAVQAGLVAATSTVAAFCDVDLSTPLSDLDRLVRLAPTGPVIAAASRDVVTTTMVRPESPQRELLGKLYNRFVQLALVPGIRDTQCGAKAATTPVWRAILAHTREAGFAWDVETLAVARRLGFAVWEVGVAWAHDDRSRVRPIRDGVAMVRAVPRIWDSVHRIGTFQTFEHLDVVLRQPAAMATPQAAMAEAH